MSRVLVVCCDLVGPEMGGTGIRAWELASVLSQEHRVTLLAIGGARMTHPMVRMLDGPSVSSAEVKALAQDHDVAVLQATSLRQYPFLASIPNLALVVDLYNPFLFETLAFYQGARLADDDQAYREALETLHELLRAGDFFLCASERQRNYWLGMLASTGRINPLTIQREGGDRRLIDVVPFGVSDSPPSKDALSPVLKGKMPGIAADDVVLLWGGGIWEWFDPVTVIRAMKEISNTLPQVKLVFLGTKHPNPAIPIMQRALTAVEVSRDLELIDSHVFFLDGWVPYPQRGAFFLDADIGVTAHFGGLETHFSFRARVLDYLWAGLPVITTEGDEMAELVRVFRTGRVLGYEDVSGWVSAITELVVDPAIRLECGKRSLDLSEQFRWLRVAGPLLQFCREPRRAADRPASSAPTTSPAPPAFAPPSPPPPAPPPTLRSYFHRANTVYRQEGVFAVLQGVARVLRRLAQV